MTYKSQPAYDAAEDAVRYRDVAPADTRYLGPMDLISSAQDFPAAWADLGGEIPVAGRTHIGLWIDVDVNDSTDLQLKILYKHTSGHADEFEMPIKVLSATDVKVEPGYFELNSDADQKLYLSFPLDGLVPYVQFQIKAGTLGAGTDAQIDSAVYTVSWAGAGGGN